VLVDASGAARALTVVFAADGAKTFFAAVEALAIVVARSAESTAPRAEGVVIVVAAACVGENYEQGSKREQAAHVELQRDSNRSGLLQAPRATRGGR